MPYTRTLFTLVRRGNCQCGVAAWAYGAGRGRQLPGVRALPGRHSEAPRGTPEPTPGRTSELPGHAWAVSSSPLLRGHAGRFGKSVIFPPIRGAELRSGAGCREQPWWQAERGNGLLRAEFLLARTAHI